MDREKNCLELTIWLMLRKSSLFTWSWFRWSHLQDWAEEMKLRLMKMRIVQEYVVVIVAGKTTYRYCTLYVYFHVEDDVLEQGGWFLPVSIGLLCRLGPFFLWSLQCPQDSGPLWSLQCSELHLHYCTFIHQEGTYYKMSQK